MTVITETDLIGGWRTGYHSARRPDDDLFRAWEIPGTAHADNYTIRVGFIDNGSAPMDDIVAAYAPTNELMGTQLSYCINFAPQHHYVLQAAIAKLNTWVRTGEPAPTAPPIALTDGDPPRARPRRERACQGRCPHPVGRRPDREDIGPGPATKARCRSSSVRARCSTPRRCARSTRGGSADYLDDSPGRSTARSTRGSSWPADRSEILELAAATFGS